MAPLKRLSLRWFGGIDSCAGEFGRFTDANQPLPANDHAAIIWLRFLRFACGDGMAVR